jgi:tetratricopeptide (TPR) repeat protein
MGRKDAAAQRLLQAVEIDPDYVEAWNNLGNVLAEQDRAPEAVRAYQSALAVEPLGHREEAEEHWRRYLELDPHSSWARQVRARLEAPPLDDGTPS